MAGRIAKTRMESWEGSMGESGKRAIDGGTEAMGTSEIEEGMKDEGRMGSVKRGGKKVQLRGCWGDIYIYLYIQVPVNWQSRVGAGRKTSDDESRYTDGRVNVDVEVVRYYVYIYMYIHIYVCI